MGTLDDSGAGPYVAAQATVHDVSHLEICLDYPMPSQTEQRFTHKVDFYFFIPKVMAISPQSYSREQFYSDITNHVRAHTPYVARGEYRLLKKIAHHIDQLIQKKSNEDRTERIIQEIKLFGNIVNRWFKIQQDGFQKDPEKSIRSLNDIDNILKAYRSSCVAKAAERTLSIAPGLKKTIVLLDEYLSKRMETILVDINAQINDLNVPIDKDLIKSQVKRLLEDELSYQKSNEDIFFNHKNTDADKEYYYYRQRVLKKLVANPLFLTLTKNRPERRYRNMVASFSAALAAVWSQFADHHAYRSGQDSDYGLQFMAVAGFAIGIYVFKDRIKDMSKEYVNEKLKDHIPDMKGTMSHPELDITGQIDEYVRFMDEKNLSSEVQFLRRLEGHWDVEAHQSDSVLHYHRSIELQKSDKNKSGDLAASSLKDILRFNLSFFLKHLDDPFKQFHSYDRDDGVIMVSFPKVYHLNLVLQMTTETEHTLKGRRIYFARYRLVLNKAGIIRIESLNPEHPLFYDEDEP